MHFIGNILWHRFSEIFKLILSLLLFIFNFTDNCRHVMLDMNKKNLWKFFSKFETTKLVWRHRRVNRMRSEESLLFCDSFFNWNLIYNIFLCSVFYTDVTETKRYFLVHYHSLSICTAVHNINLCYNTNCSYTLWIELTRHLQTIWSSHISISRNNAKNNCSWVTHISMCHCASDFFNVIWLICNSNTGNSRKINKC